MSERPENPLETIDFTGPGGAEPPQPPEYSTFDFFQKKRQFFSFVRLRFKGYTY